MFFTALSRLTGSLPRTGLPPAAAIRRLRASAAVALSSAIAAPVFASSVSAGVSASGSRDIGGLLEMVARQLESLRWSMNTVGRPSFGTSA